MLEYIKTVKINPSLPKDSLYDHNTIDRAVKIIKDGGVIAFPTRCLYGIGADAMNAKAVDKVFQIKKRPLDNPLLILIKGKEELREIVQEIPESANIIMDYFWPGKITIVFKAKKILLKNLTANSGKIGVRMPGNPISTAIVNKLSNPVTGTSANLSNEPGCLEISTIPPSLRKKIDLCLDAGTLKGGTGSTVIDVTCTPLTILREGEISAKEIYNILDKANFFK